MPKTEKQRSVENGVRYAKSPLTGAYYRVTKWVDKGDGKIQAVEKGEVDRSDIPNDVFEDLNDV